MAVNKNNKVTSILTNLKKLAKKDINLKKHEVALGLIDEIEYDHNYLEDQAGLLAYLAYEWHDENFENYRQAWITLNDEYQHNGSSVLRYEDVESDIAKLDEIKIKSEELGLDPNEVYDLYDSHRDLLEQFKNADDQYQRNEMQFRDWAS
ncbi:MAG: hypothetical protein EBY39_03100 [Flavobacteriia bacterium]|nr:hypothetical protein [Flavobacteriia bacterium]